MQSIARGSVPGRRLLFLAIAACLFGGAVRALAADASPSLTFFGWSDQHVQVDGNGKHLEPAIDAMNELPGTDYPAAIGGQVAQPAFVFGCGDITEWPTRAALDTYKSLLAKRLKFPSYDVIGNHDEGGKSPSDTVKDWLMDRYGGLTYSFESGGVRFVALYSPYDESLNSPAQPVGRKALDQLRNELASKPTQTPTIVATHLCFDAMTNRDEFLEILKPYNIVAILGGHYHKAKVDHYRGRYFVQLPSPAPGSPSEVTVIRITPRRIVAIPFDYQHHRWVTDAHKMLDASLNR